MPYIESEVLEKARQVDLLSYLQSNEPENLIKLSSDIYCTRDHDSLKISNGKWYWFSRGFGGVTALDYLMKVQNCSLQQAVMKILGGMVDGPSFSNGAKAKETRRLLLPEYLLLILLSRGRNTLTLLK